MGDVKARQVMWRPGGLCGGQVGYVEARWVIRRPGGWSGGQVVANWT